MLSNEYCIKEMRFIAAENSAFLFFGRGKQTVIMDHVESQLEKHRVCYKSTNKDKLFIHDHVLRIIVDS
jgi:hypothetical protein